MRTPTTNGIAGWKILNIRSIYLITMRMSTKIKLTSLRIKGRIKKTQMSHTGTSGMKDPDRNMPQEVTEDTSKHLFLRVTDWVSKNSQPMDAECTTLTHLLRMRRNKSRRMNRRS